MLMSVTSTTFYIAIIVSFVLRIATLCLDFLSYRCEDRDDEVKAA